MRACVCVCARACACCVSIGTHSQVSSTVKDCCVCMSVLLDLSYRDHDTA